MVPTFKRQSHRLQSLANKLSYGSATYGRNCFARTPVAPFSSSSASTRQQAAVDIGVQEGSPDNFFYTMNSRSEEPQQDIDPPSDPSSTTGILTNWIQQQSLDNVSAELVERTKYIILDGLACALLAAQLPESQVAAKSVFGMESPGNCTVIGWNKRLGPLPAALLNSTFIQGFEIDDVHREAPWHANSIILPALFAAIEHSPRADSLGSPHSGKSFLTSSLIGFELGGRIGRSLSGKEMLSRGWHSGAVFGPAAAAGAVSRQLRMSPQQTEDAIGTACTQACGLMSAQYGTMAKRMQHGFAARNGLFAALTARDNYTGIDQVFERPYGGYLSVFSQGSKQPPATGSREDALTQGLGHDWTAVEGICPKPYASMVGTHGAIDCIRTLQAQNPTRFQDLTTIKSIKIDLNEAWFHHSGQEITNPTTVCGAQMSTRYCAALQLTDHAVLPANFTTTNLNRETIWTLIDKTSCVHDAKFDRDHPTANPTRVTVEFDDGSTLTEQTLRPSTTSSPMTNDDIREKWRSMASSCIDAERMRRIEDAVMNLDRLDDVSKLIRLLAPETTCPI